MSLYRAPGGARQSMRRKLFYRKFLYQKTDMARFLAERHGFDNLHREAKEPGTSRSKFFFIKHTLLDLVFLIKRRRTIRRYDEILALWHSAMAFIILKRLGLIDYDKLLWFGFSVREPFWERLYRLSLIHI